jgi:catechol 2,3-dioxygenase-like lactoylglutathione lyase family enzyme
MQNVMPTLRITDYEKSKAFYVDGLGFRVDWEHRFEQHLPVFLKITRDTLSLYLSEHEGDCRVGGLVHLYVPDVDQWYSDIQEKRFQTLSIPTDQPWGNRDFRIADPDGNQLCICTPTG